MSDTVHGPWEQAENSDYDEQKPGSGDSHEDEYDDEYGEQQPKGDPNQPDNKLEDAYQADIEYWEEIARLNAMAKPYDPDAPVTADPAARPYDPDAPVSSDPSDPLARPYDPDAPVTTQPNSLDPDDFDRVDSVEHVGPPTPDSAMVEPDLSSGPPFDPAVPLADAFADGSYQPVIVDPGPPSPSLDPAVSFADAVADSSVSPSSQMDSADLFEADDSYQAGSPSINPEFKPDIPEQTDWNDFIG
jgi:hypothetical protein